MLLKMEVTSSRAETSDLEIGADVSSPDLVQLRGIDGLGPVKASIQTAPRSNTRGEVQTGTAFPKRNIVLTLGLNPDWDTHNISSLRQLLYAYFMTGEECKLRFFTDYLPTVEIEGVVESFEPNIFSKDPEIQVSILCLQPDFVAIDATEIEGEVNLGDLTEIQYQGTVSTGVLLEVKHSVAVPTFNHILEIYMEKEEFVGEYMQIEAEINSDQWLEVSSVAGDRHVHKVQNFNPPIHTNIFSQVVNPYTGPVHWPILEPGLNLFSVSASGDDPGQLWTLTYYDRFGGL